MISIENELGTKVFEYTNIFYNRGQLHSPNPTICSFKPSFWPNLGRYYYFSEFEIQYFDFFLFILSTDRVSSLDKFIIPIVGHPDKYFRIPNTS